MVMAGFETIVNTAKNNKMKILTNMLFKIRHVNSKIRVNTIFISGSMLASLDLYAYLSVSSKTILLF